MVPSHTLCRKLTTDFKNHDDQDEISHLRGLNKRCGFWHVVLGER
jgi:hypothetical protein